MQRFYISLLIVCCMSAASAQQKNRQPLILQGKLSHSPEKFLQIYFYDENDKKVHDTLHLDEHGAFYLKTYKITRPQRTDIRQNRTQISRIYVAPGYNLQITADATNHMTLLASKKITGIGEESNQYRVLRDAAFVAQVDKRSWYERKPEEVVPYIKEEKRLNDSIYHKVFDLPQTRDPYFSVFKKMSQIDNQSMFLIMMLEFSMNSGFSREQMKDLVHNNIPPLFAKGISNDDYLIAEDYVNAVLPLYYQYHKKLMELEDFVTVQKKDHALQLVNQVFTGKVRQAVLRYAVTRPISGSNTIEALNTAKKDAEPLFDAITSNTVKQDIAASYSERESQLMQLQVGQAAPLFSLPDEQGKIYHLANLKGKVIYIDLWASWCAPCRAEMPNFKKLRGKFKGNDQVAFMGIAVFDAEKDWRTALSEDKPDWLQLHDTTGSLAKSYVASAIPKYILIDKNGKVLDLNAPGPGDQSIEQLIKDEIDKP
ncbi:TlpA family protein disulfide reductase [Pedobacter sp. SAFR-022]|uniref:TlpA family protein disulfide reductase n=1 Tax=Pedobacter sp. SAFR-022 TaxID=3436861 RepID=UPI003F800E2E